MMAHRPRGRCHVGGSRVTLCYRSVRDNVRLYAARLGRHHLRAHLGAADRDGHRRARPPRPARRRDRARRGLRHRRRDAPAARAAAGRARDRGRRRAVDGRAGARAAARRGRRARGRPARARARASRSTRCSRPRRSTGSPTTSGCSRTCTTRCAPGGRLVAQCGGHGNVAAVKQAGLDVARRGALRRALRRLGDRLEVRHARGHRAAPAGGRLHRRLVLAHPGRRRPGRPGRLPARDLPRLVPRPAARGAARAVRRRRARAAPRPAGDPLRAAEHPGPHVRRRRRKRGTSVSPGRRGF